MNDLQEFKKNILEVKPKVDSGLYDTLYDRVS